VVHIVALTAENIEAVLAVQARPGQERHVKDVAWYVARSAYEQVWTPVAFQDGAVIVGFAEWAFDPSDQTHCIGGVVIDGELQGRGYGRQAMGALVEHLRAKPECRTVALSVHPDNVAARRLYGSMGFTDNGDTVDDELVMVLPG
jgi:diamine N-acetyltransferase